MTTTRPKNRIVISHYGGEGDCVREVHVVSKEAEAEVTSLLERLEQRRRETGEQLMSLYDAVDELDVPEAERHACADAIKKFLAAETRTDGYVDFEDTPFERRHFTQLLKKLPDGYAGSWLEREVISSELEDSYYDLTATAKIIHRLADKMDASVEPYEAKCLLRQAAYAFDNASQVFARSDGPTKQEVPA